MFAITVKSLALTFPIFSFFLIFASSPVLCEPFNPASEVNASLTYLWPLPSEFSSGDETLSVDPALSLVVGGNGGSSAIVRAAFDRYRGIIFKHTTWVSPFDALRRRTPGYDISTLKIVVHSDSEYLQLGVDESYSLFVSKNDGESIIETATIEANTVYGALRGLEVCMVVIQIHYIPKHEK